MKKIISILMLLGVALIPAHAQYLQEVAPEQVGLNGEHLRYADEAIEQAIHDKTIPGAVLAVVRHGKMAYLKAYGNKRVYPYTEKMTTGTIFDLASCSKAVSTATSVMILLQEGKIRLLDPVKFYLPEFKNWEDGKPDEETIRIVNLLTHTSGLPPYAPVEELKKKYGAPNPEGLMEYISTCKRDTAPAREMSYSCLNYITLQHIIEKISGESLKDFAKEHIFEPLGMKYTCYQPGKELLPLIAPTEKQKDGSVLWGVVHDPLARIMNGGISGNAGVFSSAPDLGIFVAMLLNNGEWNGTRILSPLTVKALRTVPASLERFGRSLGWDLHSPYASNNGDLFGPNTFGHTGYTGTSIVIDPDTDTGVILLTNSVHPTDGHSVVRLRSLVSNIVAASIMDSLPRYTAHYYARTLQFEKEPPITNKDIVILGNSLTENGGDWSKRLATPDVINRGIIGDITNGVYDRLYQILPGHPKRIYMMIGINDVSHNLSADSIAGNIKTIVKRIKTDSPSTRLYMESLLPINESFGRYKLLRGKTDFIPTVNERIETIAKEEKVHYINLFPLFTESGTNVLRKELSVDGLHLNEQGYAIWCKALKKTL